MKKNYNFINKYKIELIVIVILILILISICIYYFYKKNNYEGFFTTTANTIDNWTQIGNDIDGEAANDQSGNAVALSSDGTIVAITAMYNGVNESHLGHVRIYKWVSGSWTQLGNDINGESFYDQSGNSVALSSNGTIVAIGATGNNGSGSYSGHVRIYQWINNSWSQLGNDINGEAAYDNSGNSVALSSDGTIVAIGTTKNDGNGSNSGHVRIYKWINNSWTQLGNDIDGEAANDQSGNSVALSSDGTIVAIGATGNNDNGLYLGHVRIYKWVSENWSQLGNDIDGEAAYDKSGNSVALSSDGTIVAIGTTKNDGNGSNSGHVRIYKWINNSWTQLGNDIDGEAANDQSGNSVALSSNGTIVAIGAVDNNGNGLYSGHVRIYKWINNSWSQFGNDINGEAAYDKSGNSVALNSDGTIVAIGAPYNGDNGSNLGHVRIYTSPLPIDCVGDFVNTGECSKTCGGGKQIKTYEIKTPAQYGGVSCPNINGDTQLEPCNTQPCPINCIGSFVNDGVCVTSNDLNLNCGKGKQTQKYVITQPALYGGTQCTFTQNQPQIIPCELAPCPIDCEGSFGEFGTCSKGCGGGKQEKIYTITKEAQYEGKACPNKNGDTEELVCNIDPCPINCEGTFLDFKSCSRECGKGGILLKKYNITTQAQYGGNECPNEQNDVKSIPCNTDPCPTYPENTAIKEALKDSNNKIKNIRYDIINRQEELDLLTNKFNRLNKNISLLKNNSNYVPDAKNLKFY